MIYTVTFNPSLDYIVSVSDFKLGLTNRTDSELLLPGGKGINVSTVLQNLGIANTAFGFTAGFVGEEVRKEVEQLGVKAEFISLDEGVSRINLKLKSIDGTEINGRGPRIPREAVDALMTQLDRLGADDTLVLAGSIPATMPDDIYQKIMERLDGRDVRIVVDATKDLLLNVLGHHPFLIKPNNHELGEMFQTTLTTEEEIIAHAKKLQERGARNVLVSMAKDGAILVTEDGEIYKKQPHNGTVVNSVGAGDSMVAGFLAGYLNTGSYERALELGTAAGSATAFQSWLASREDIVKLLDRPYSEYQI